MTNTNSGCAILVSRAVEEPIDATFELGEELKSRADILKKPVFLGILATIISIILFSFSIYNISIFYYSIARGITSLSTTEFFRLLFVTLIIIFTVAIIVSTMVYLVQIYKFYTHLMQRYALLNELKGSQIDDTNNKHDIHDKHGTQKKDKTSKNAKTKDNLPATGKHVQNPIFAMLDLIEESMHELPQLIRLLNLCKYFLGIILILIILNLITGLFWGLGLFFRVDYLKLIFGLISLFTIIPTIYLLMDSRNFYSYILTRHQIIDSIRFGDVIKVPEGDSQVKRLVKYLSESDPYLVNSNSKVSEWDFGKVSGSGAEGQGYVFDAYISSDNTLYGLSSRLCIPMGKFAVFIKQFKKPITIKRLVEYRKSVLDLCTKEQVFPLRIMALQHEISELVDDVYEYVLGNPVKFERSVTHLQIAAEDGEIYSFIPQISYGGMMNMESGLK